MFSNCKFKRGDRVIIVGHKRTDRRFGTNSDMMDMFVGKRTYLVQDCDSDSVEINEFYWHPDDVESVNKLVKDPEPKIFHFDVEKLEV